ncbi:hypothetical protein EOM39_05185 [Candidatus Gracilibacteria bacterium]|nr:hypothetical protein [Candidatus Gracilibacteria bacterium]
MFKKVQSYRNLEILFYSYFTIGLIIIVGFRPLEYFRDTHVYLEMIATYDHLWMAEPTFWIINQFNQLLLGGNDQIFFLIYAILGVTIKIIAINRLSSLPLLSVYLYICLYFVLHEMTQIRVGVACGIFLLAIPDIVNKNFRIYLFKTLIAMAFHYSAIIMLVVYFVNNKNINRKIYFFLPIIGLFLAFIPNLMLTIFTFFEFILPSVIANKVTIYISLIDNEDYNKINIFNLFTLSLICFYYFALFNIWRLKTELDIVLIKFFGLQLFIYYAFSSIPVFAIRLSEFIGFSLILLIPNLIFMFKQKLLPILFILVWGGGYFWFVSINIINFGK